MKYLTITVLSFFVICFPLLSPGEILKRDTVWNGEIVIEGDILIPQGTTLTILPGTVINIKPSDRTKTDPEYLSSLTEITVRGRLQVEGEKDEPVIFHVKERNEIDLWAGIILDGGSANIKNSTIQNAETGISVIAGFLSIKDSNLKNNRYGLVAYKSAVVYIKDTHIIKNNYGVFELAGAKVNYRDVVVKENKKKDLYLYGSSSLKPDIKDMDESNIFIKDNNSCKRSDSQLKKYYELPEKEVSKKYKDEVLLGDTIWRGRIEIDGLIRVPEGVRLIIMPGTIIEFKRKDTDGDGVGENGLLMQGVLIAKGTREKPIIFRSAERYPGRGDWGAINIMNSDGVQNLVEFCQIENAYRGLHFHFSNVMVNSSILENNYRAIQFQESAVELRNNYIFNNKSGIKARDSEIFLTGNYIFNNINGVNFFRTNLTAKNNSIMNNLNEGFKIREGMSVVQENLIDCNRFGLMINDSFFGKFMGNVVSNNYETGIALKNSDNVDLSENFIQGSGFNGINILSSGALIKGNHISENGERGIGIQSFAGAITENNIIKNGLYAIENESNSEISAPKNWFGDVEIDMVLFDKNDDPTMGEINYTPVRKTPLPFPWRLKTIQAYITWYDRIYLQDTVTVHLGSTLRIAPGAKIIFSKGVGMNILGGKLIALGEKDKRIIFTSLTKSEDNVWNEILLEYANGSVFSYCDFEYATWAVHSHFTDLKIVNSRFRKNYGGMRFRSGPIEISKSLFTENVIGLRAYRANAMIMENNITNNEIGIFVREKGGGLTIRRNNIYSNTNYNIRSGDFNEEDIDARENWWGTDNPAETIFDGRKEPGVGKVIFEPFYKEKVNIKG
jgi:parallel beta-helix repeat protein